MSARKDKQPRGRGCKDHMGNYFSSQRQMCSFYGISPSLFCNRRKWGWSLQECLEGRDPVFVSDHLQNRFPSVEAMCAYYGISLKNYYARLARGWSLEKTLTFPIMSGKG